MQSALPLAPAPPVHPVLTFMASAAGMDIAADRIHRHVHHHSIHGGVETGWQDHLASCAAALDLNIFLVTRSLSEAVRAADPSAPWITLAYPDGAVSGWVAILGRRAGKVHVQELDGHSTPRWVTTHELVSSLGIIGPGAPVEWALAEPAAPLADMRSPVEEGATPHSGKDGAGGGEHHGISPFARLRALLKAEKSDLWVVVIYSIFAGLLTLVVPIAVQSLVNSVAFGMVLQPLVVLTIFVLVALGFSAFMNGMRVWVVELMQQRIFARVAMDVTHRLVRVRPEAFDKKHGPELVNRFFDVVTVQKAGAMLLLDGLSIFMQTATGMILLAIYHPWLLAFDVLLVGAILFVLFGLGRGATPTSIKESKAKYAVAAWLEEIPRHLVTFKTGGAAAYAMRTSDGLVRTYLESRKKHFKIVLRQVAGSLILQAVASAMLLGIGGWLVIQRQLTLGQLVAAELIVAMVVSGFAKFGKHLEIFYDLLAAVDKLGQLVDLPLERSGGRALPAVGGPASIRFRDVSFGYPNRPDILSGAHWTLQAGARAGLLGPSGSGKSAFIDLIYSLRSPHSGGLEIDGTDYREVSMDDLRAHIALVRENEIFEGSVAENVSLGRTGIGPDEIRAALGQTGLLEEILALPGGIHAPLSTGGLPLSPGQSSRLMIARAIAGNPRLLILDESLDRIDDVRDREILFGNLFSPEAPWTLLVVTHSPGVLQHCSEVHTISQNGIQLVPEFSNPGEGA